MAPNSLSQHLPRVQNQNLFESTLTFNTVHLNIIDHAGKPWVRGSQIAEALGYGQTNRINDIYTRHADEFTDAMTAVVTLPTEGGPQETRIFSLRGCHLLAMFARMPVAKEFRRWVLDVLETWETTRAHQLILPSAPLTPFFPAPRDLSAASRRRLVSLVDAKLDDVPPRHIWRARMRLWAALNRRYAIAQYRQLPEDRLPDALAFLTSLEIGPRGHIRLTDQQALPSRPMDTALRTASALSALIEQARDVLAAPPAAPAVREVEA